MENASHWYFTKEQLENTPTRKCGIEASKELSYRQQAANFIQDMGQRLQVTQLCINTAIVYMHRFYMFHSFTKLHRNQIAVAALFLAAKVEEQPRKLEHVVRVAHKCLHRGEDLDPKSESFMAKCAELVYNENMMLQTLGFEIGIDHPHTYVVKLLQLVKASKDLAQTSYFMATNSLHLTTMCLQYKPTVVACVCIHLACKWSNWKIEPCSEGKEWYYYVDKSVTPELLEELTKDFLAVLEKSPNRLKRRVGPENNNKDGQSAPSSSVVSSVSSSSKSGEEFVGRVEALSVENNAEVKKELSPVPSTSALVSYLKEEKPAAEALPPQNAILELVSHNSPAKKAKVEMPHSISLAVYREKREKERSTEQRPAAPAHPEMPSSVSSAKSIAPPPEKHTAFAVSQEKRPVKPNIASSELVPHKTAEKLNLKHGVATAHAETTSRDRVNHQVTKPPASATAPAKSVLPTKNQVIKNAPLPPKPDPFVLLTRVDQACIKKSASDPKVTVDATVGGHDLKTAIVPSLDDKKAVEARLKTEHAPSLNINDHKSALAKVLVAPADAHQASKSKHPKQKPVSSSTSSSSSLHNSHHDFPVAPQVNQEKPNMSWDTVKSNGSGVPEPTVPENRLHPPAEDSKPVDRGAEGHGKHERRERHRHKHAVHSSKDKSSVNHVPVTPPLPPGETPVPAGGIKITIPKDKLVLSGMHLDSNQKPNASAKEESPRTSLKVKIPKVKPSSEAPSVSVKPNSSGSGLKLVFMKDQNAGGWNTTIHKGERPSRKRQRSPGSKDHGGGESSVKAPKVHTTDKWVHKTQTDGLQASSVKADKQNCLTGSLSHHNTSGGGELVAQTNPANMKHMNADMYHHQNNIAQQQQYMMPYNVHDAQQYYQQYYQYSMPATNMQYGHMQPPPLPPNMAKAAAPPLPREPPPPLPPQPPLPSE